MNRELKSMDKAEWSKIPFYTKWTLLDRNTLEVIFQSENVKEVSDRAKQMLEADEDLPLIITKHAFCLVRCYIAQMGDPEYSKRWHPEQMSWEFVYSMDDPEQNDAYLEYSRFVDNVVYDDIDNPPY